MRTLLGFAAAFVAAFSTTAAFGQIKLEVLSSRPELVTGTSALVRVTGTPMQPPAYASNDTLIAPMYSDGRGGWIGIIPELNPGAENKLFALPGSMSAGPEVEVRVQSHAVNDTLFAGPQVIPFRCENEAHGLGVPLDAGCTAPLVLEYYYRSTAGGWRSMNPSLAPPADVAMTTTSNGKTVPLIVRVEKGVANRSAYAIAVLSDPAKPTPRPWDLTGLGWNGRLIFAVGGGVGNDGHAMGPTMGFLDPKAGYVGGENDGLYETLINAGYAIAAASLVSGGATGNDVVQAETVEKVKEQFIKRFGPPSFTIAVGKDGGVAPMLLVAQNYPGLFDGIYAINGYADNLQLRTTANDCGLIGRYFGSTNVAWTDAQKRFAGGFSTLCVAPPPAAAPCSTGTPCSLDESLATVVGREPKTGAALSTWDNTGIQYGLVGFKLGLISEAQFLDLNAAIGGRASDGGSQPQRNAGDSGAIRNAYASGRVLTGGDGLASTAVVAVRLYPVGTCGIAPCAHGSGIVAGVGDRSMALRTRLEVASLSRGNMSDLIIEDEPAVGGPDGGIAKVMAGALRNLDKWLTDVVANPSPATRPEKIVTRRPLALRDTTCIAEGAIFTDAKTCDMLVPAAPGPRVAAGAPVSDDVLKCALKPIDPADYPATAGRDLVPKLRQIFPDGVCDFSRPGIGQVPLAGTWLAYTADGKFAVSALP